MEVGEKTQLVQGERLRPELRWTHLTPLEHAIMGSSVEVRKNGEAAILNSEQIIAQEEGFLFTPLGITTKEKDINAILAEREGKYLEGYFAIFASPEMWEGGYTQRIYLANMGADGKIKAVFRAQLIRSNGTIVEDEDVVNRLLQVTQLKENFQMVKDASSNRFLVFAKVKSKPEQPVAELV